MTTPRTAHKRRYAIIDADSILYAISLSAEMCAKKQGADGEDLWFQVRPVEDCYQEALTKFEAILETLDADEGIVCLSDARCFRYDVYPLYKANRARTRRPPMMVHLREEIIERSPHRVICVETLEADDVVGITSTGMRAAGRDAIMVSLDKDLLTIPGVLHRKGRTFVVTPEEADRAHMYQTLIGDYVDGYPGCEGIGPKRANKILDGAASQTPRDLWLAAKAAFVARDPSNGHNVAVTMAQVARILRNTDWDASSRKVKLWQPPT